MIPGFPTTTPPGGHEEFLRSLTLTVLNGQLRARFQPVSGYSQYWQPMFDGVVSTAPVYGADDVVTEVVGYLNPMQTKHVCSICPMGDWSAAGYDVSAQQLYFEALRAERIRVTVTPSLQYFANHGSTQFSSWSLTGLQRFTNCAPYARRPTYGALDIRLVTSGGVRTLTLMAAGTPVMSGTRTVAAGDGSITVAALNSSGASGSVVLTYSADIALADGKQVLVRWPASYPVHYRTSTFAAPDFPRTEEGIVTDDGRSNSFVFRSGALAANTYYVLARQRDDTANDSTNLDGGGVAATVVGVPAAPGAPAYSSGGAAATVISFTASTTSLATYNIYDSGVEGVIDMTAVSGTRAAGSGTLTHTLAAISGSFTGTRYVIVRSVSTGGVEDGNSNTLAIEYSSGVVILPRPPKPGVGTAITTSGRAITVPCFVNTADQAVAASTLKIWLVAVGTPIDYTLAESASVSVPAAIRTNVNVNITATAGSDGDYRFGVKTVSAAGTQSNNTDEYGPFRLTTTVPGAPASTLVEVGY